MNLDAIYQLPPTRRLYNHAPYQQQATATVLYVENDIAVFDQTLFYAESGGQIYDTGQINGQQVIAVKKYLGEFSRVVNQEVEVPSVKVNTRIVHTFSAPVTFRPGDEVTMMIDWQRRYRIMTHHTLAHFLYHAIMTLFKQQGRDLFLKGCAINEEKSSFSLNNKITEQDMAEIEQIVRAAFVRDTAIEMAPEPTNDEVYYWRYQDIVIPCGGTHLKNTREIDDFTLWRKSEGKQKSKVYIKAL